MSSSRGEEVYRQRFTADEKVVEMLNHFLVKDQAVFNFYSKQTYEHASYPPVGYDNETGQPLSDGMDHVRAHVDKIKRRAIDMGSRTLHLAQHVTVLPSRKVLRMNFTPVEAAAYFNIIYDLHGLDPDHQEIGFNWSDSMNRHHVNQFVREDLYVDIKMSNMHPRKYSVAREILKHTLADPDDKYLMTIQKVDHVDYEHIPPHDDHGIISA